MSFLCAILLALAQAQPDNPHDVNNKDRPPPSADQSTANQGARARDYINPNPTTNPEVKGSEGLPQNRTEAAEKDNPHHVKNGHERMTMSSPSDILMHLHAANLEEIDAGQMAMKEGGPRAQDFGRMLVDDHRDADKKVKDLASKLGVKLDDTMGRMKMKDAHAKLEGKSGADFDKTFASAMIDGHKHVIDMVKSARASCKDRDVCNLLDEMLPTLQKHLRAAEDLKAPAAQGRTPEKR